MVRAERAEAQLAPIAHAARPALAVVVAAVVVAAAADAVAVAVEDEQGGI